MRLYVTCPNTKRRIYLSLIVEKRSQIQEPFGIDCPFDNETHWYNREDVNAEPSLGTSAIGTILGGLVGAIVGGPIGAILGGGAGLVIGNNNEEEERRRVRNFYEGNQT